MQMSPGLRKFTLTFHVAVSVGWLGAVIGFLALAVPGLTNQNETTVRAVYIGMEIIGRWIIVPLCVASLLTGLVQSIGTQWGLLRHYWILIKFLITVISAVILFVFMRTLIILGDFAENVTAPIDALRSPSPVVHSSLALLALLAATALSVYKPRGLTAYGKRQKRDQFSGKN